MKLWKRMNEPLRGGERGVALLMVLLMLAVLSSTLLDFSYQTRGEITAAKNAREEVQAEYLARSAIEIQRLLVMAWSQSSADQLGLGLEQVSQVLELILNTGDLSGVVGGASSAFNATGLGQLPGALLMPPPQEESNKINLNAKDFAKRQTVFTKLRDALTDERYQELFTKDAQLVPDPAGEFAGSVLDWSDRDTTLFGGSGPENDPYGLQEDAYQKKDTPFYSVDELHLVWGVGDDLFYTLADGVTIYGNGGGEVDIVKGAPVFLRSALCSCLATPNDVALVCGTTPAPIDIFIQAILPLRTLFPLMGIRSWQNFTTLQDTLGSLGASLGPVAAMLPQLPDISWAPACQGVTFGAKATVYTLRGASQVGDVRVRLRAVLDLTLDRQTGGRLLYWRVE